ncbi:MAG: MaoC family dehydratase [Casimicrobiaceae bacterium]
MSKGDAMAPIAQRYFEDYPMGAIFEGGPINVDEAEVIAFARRYDPQPFHIDAEAAARTMYGGIIASGWHTAAMTMRALVDKYLSSVASLGSPGVDDLRWILPVRPGDTLYVRIAVIEARRSRSKLDRGFVRTLIETRNQRGEQVLSMKAMNLMLCRDPAPAAGAH